MELKEITEKVNRLSEELEKLRPLKPEDEQRVMQKFRLDWNYNSNNIEGNSLTYGETKALLLFGITAQGKPLKDHLEIEGHNEAIDYIIKVARNEVPLTEAMIRNLHKMILHEEYEIDAITADGQPIKKLIGLGKYKTTPNHVKTVTGELFRFASPEETPAKMGDLMKWYNDNFNSAEIYPFVFAAEFHYRFIRIHPFDDGNGRLVRLLLNLILLQKGFPPIIVKVKEKEDYYRALQQADSGELEAFYIFIGEQLLHSLEIMVSAAKGNDIEEDDDIDKEIALFKANLEKVDEIKVVYSNTTLESISSNFIIPFFNIYFEKMVNIVDFFREQQLSIWVNGNNLGNYTEIKVLLSEFSNKFKSFYVNNKVTNLELRLKLKDFKKSIDKPFDMFIQLYYNFDYHNYFISARVGDSGKKLVFDKQKHILYHQNYTKQELNDLFKNIKKLALAYIKEKVQE